MESNLKEQNEPGKEPAASYPEKKNNEHDSSLDIIRCFAFFLVVSVHFFLNNGYYNQPIKGVNMYIMTLMGVYFRACVPLFILLTGYLVCRKKGGKKYYKGIFKVLITYLFASIFCILYRNLFLHEGIDFVQGIFLILGFSGAKYAWYVEMYLGLFLLIPFLNLIYQHLDTKEKKLGLIFTLAFLSSVPFTVNVFSTIGGEYRKIIPSWWERIYPALYYFIGAFFREYSFPKKTVRKLLIILVCVAGWGSAIYALNYERAYDWGLWILDYNPLPIVILSSMTFLLLKNLQANKLPGFLKKFIRYVADLCFGAYLLSYIFDSHFYPILEKHVKDMPDRLPYYFIIVPAVFVCSLALSFVLHLISTPIDRWIYRKK